MTSIRPGDTHGAKGDQIWDGDLRDRIKRWHQAWWWGIKYDWNGWRSGESNWWQALWGHNVTSWWKVPGFMRRWR